MDGTIIFLVVSFFAGAFATVAGFGSSTVLLPIATFFMDVKTALFLVACFHLFNNLFKVGAFWRNINFRLFWFFGIPSILCAFIGAYAVSLVSAQIIEIILGLMLIVLALYGFFQPQVVVPKSDASAVTGGGLSGLMAGLTGLGGAVRSAFLITFGLAKHVYIGTSAMIALVIDLTRVPTYLFTGIVKEQGYYTLIPFLCISAYAGVRAGKYVIDKINYVVFRRIVLAAVLLAGIKLIF